MLTKGTTYNMTIHIINTISVLVISHSDFLGELNNLMFNQMYIIK
jgi:hypothetical protein